MDPAQALNPQEPCIYEAVSVFKSLSYDFVMIIAE